MIRGDTIEQALAEWLGRPTLVLGVGNPLRGDDAAGPMVCAGLRSPRAVDCGDAPERYLGLAADARVNSVLLVDAMDFGGAAGEIAFCYPEDLVERFGTTHDSGLAVLARFIQQEYGKPVAVLGIQPSQTRFGTEMSTAVRGAIEKVIAWLQGGAWRGKPEELETAWTCS